MDLMEEIKFYIKDEEEANVTYLRMAGDADNAGMHKTAQILRGIAVDELKHKELLEGMYYKPEFGPVVVEHAGFEYEQYLMRGKGAQEKYVKEQRKTPETYGEWIDLSEDIKQKSRDLSSEVNTNLGYIFTGTPSESDEGKRWLLGKSKELGLM